MKTLKEKLLSFAAKYHRREYSESAKAWQFVDAVLADVRVEIQNEDHEEDDPVGELLMLEIQRFRNDDPAASDAAQAAIIRLITDAGLEQVASTEPGDAGEYGPIATFWFRQKWSKRAACDRLTKAGYNAEITRDGLLVTGDGWEAFFSNAGQDYNTYSGKVPSEVDTLAVWDDDASSRK